MRSIAIVWDCGSTNLRVVAVDEKGGILAQHSQPNGTVPQPGGDPAWRVWDVDQIWKKLCRSTAAVLGKVKKSRIAALTITTWGADGTAVDPSGKLRYPLISWQCPRTLPYIEKIKAKLSPAEIFVRTGYQLISFNTLFKLMWLKDHAPEALEGSVWMMTAGILSHRLTGEFSIDPTGAGTSMAMALKTRDWDPKMLEVAGIDRAIFPRWVEPGSAIGTITPSAAAQTGLPGGIPVVATGHDTQFAIYGSGARPDEAILSSGTWEIVIIRVASYEPKRVVSRSGLIFEQDAVKGYLDPQFLMMGSAALEWVRANLYRSASYEKMISEAERADASGLRFIPTFVPTAGPASPYGTPGSIVGIGLGTTPAQVYRAALEGLCFQLRHALEVFREAAGFTAKGIRLVGGGSKNPLWVKLRADITGLPVTITEHKEATVLGAALFAFVGAGVYPSVRDAQRAVDVGASTTEPSGTDEYAERYDNYRRLVRSLGT